MFWITLAHCATISGQVTDSSAHPVSFATVYLQGTTIGTSSNMEGKYSFEARPGEYQIVFRMIGYKQFTKSIKVGSENLVIHAYLVPETATLKEVTVSADGEDPAYPIIRNAIKKRKYYLEQVDSFSCDVYIKGEQRILKHPEKILGQEVDPENEIDSLTKIVYLSESVSRFNFIEPDRIHEEMISSKVSGDNHAFSYNQASDMLFNFYKNVMDVAGLSDRGFISPIAGDAMFYYKYHLVSSFVENNLLVNKIQVIPKRKSDPVFSGYIYIMEDSWRIHSVDLSLTKDANIDFVDTLHIEQVHVPVSENAWMPFSNKFTFVFSFLGFQGDGMYVGLNRNYNLHPDFPKKYFGMEDLHINDDANKKDSVYWKDTRPIPLTEEEENDYKRREALYFLHHTKAYRDSIDKKENKFKVLDLITGYDYERSYKMESYSFRSPFSDIAFNTVEGVRLAMSVAYTKSDSSNKRFTLTPSLRYGFSNTHFNPAVSSRYVYNPQRSASVSFGLGQQVSNFNGSTSLTPIISSLYSLLDGKNYSKLYERRYVSFGHYQEIRNGIYIGLNASWEERLPLVNTTNFSWVNQRYTSNNPEDPLKTSAPFSRHEALLINASVNLVFRQRYFTRPNEKIVTGSKYPKLYLSYEKGIHSVLGSDVDFDRVTLSVSGDKKWNLLGTTTYLFTAGTFPNANHLFYMDHYFFNGNQTLYSSFRINDFNLPGYYEYVIAGPFAEAHIEHNFNRFILNKFPLVRKLKLDEHAGVHTFSAEGFVPYSEFFVGIEKLKVIRLDFVEGFKRGKSVSTGLRIGFKI